MKSILLISLLALLFSTAHGQLWKEYGDSARAYLSQKNADKAIGLYSRELEELKKDSAGTNSYAQVCDTLGISLFGKGQYQDAETVFLEAKQIREQLVGKQHPDYAKSCLYLGTIYLILEQYDKAEPLLLDAKQIEEKLHGKENRDYALSCLNLANLYQRMRQFEKAEALFLEAKEIREKLLGKQHPDYTDASYKLSLLYEDMGQYEKAEPLFLEAKQIKEKLVGHDNLDYARCTFSLGLVYIYMKQYAKAEPQFVEAKQIIEKLSGKQNADYAESCNGLAMAYDGMGQYEKAEPLLLESKQIRENMSGKENPGYVNVSNNLAQLYTLMGRYEKAEPLFLEAKQIKLKLYGKQNPDYATACDNLAGLYAYTGQYEKAEPLFLEAKEIREKLLGKLHPDYASTCYNLGILYTNMGLYKKAEPLFLEALQIQEQLTGKRHPDYAASCNSLAALYVDMGQNEKAEPLYLAAKEIWEETLGKQSSNYADACNNVALLYWKMGQYEKVEPLYLEAKQIREKIGGRKHPNYASSCNNLAGLYIYMGQYENAEPLLLESKEILEETVGKQHPDYANACNGLALLYDDMGQYAKAEPLYLEGMQIQAKVLGKQHPAYALSCNNLAKLYRDSGRYDRAVPLYLEAIQIQAKALGKEHPEYALSCADLGELYATMGQFEKAKPLLLEAKQIREKTLGKEHPDYESSCVDMACFYWSLHQPLRAEKEFKESFSINSSNLFSVFQVTNEKEKADFIQNVLGEDDIVYSFYVSEKIQSDHPYSLSLFHRNLILSSSAALQKQLYEAGDTALNNDFKDWLDLKKYLSALYSKPIDERKEDVTKIEAKKDQLEKNLARLSSAFKKQQKKVGWKDIQDKLQSHEASIEFASFKFNNGKRLTDSIFYVALVLRKDLPLPVTVFLCTEKQLTNLLSATGHSTTNDAIKTLYTSRGVIGTNKIAANKSIYDLVWKPLGKELTGIRTIYFAAAGMLHRIAFAALPINKNEVLSDKYNLVQLASTASIPDLSPTFVTTADNLQLYGGIKYDTGTFKYLPGTEAEIDSIETLAQTRQLKIAALSGANATEESFKALDGKASPSVIHIATHGFFFPDPKDKPTTNFQSANDRNGSIFRQSANPLLRSGLLFANANLAWQGKSVEGQEDGILTAYEVSNMYLPNTKLVVLSACETALGDIQGSEGVYGLQRSFKIAGVPNLIMSLWKVPDAETVEFMHEFYKNLFTGKSISTAFYQARDTLKAKYRTDPYKWAAWVLVR